MHDESLRESAVRLDFVRGSLLVAGIGEHALFARADKFEISEVGRSISAVQALLGGADLAHALSITASRRV